jgi:MFS family permease
MATLVETTIAQEFNVPLTDVTFVFTITLWMRLVGAVSSGWLGDRLGRRLPLMISILGYSLCNFIAGFSPTFWFLFLFRALLGVLHGSGMAGRRRFGYGAMAAALARLDEWGSTGLVGHRLSAVERSLRAAL